MLVLTRKEGEQIRIGDDIVVTVVRSGGDKIRLGIEAPPSVSILRSELKATKPATVMVEKGVEKERAVEKQGGPISFKELTVLGGADAVRFS